MSEEKCNYCQGTGECAYKKELTECDLCQKLVCECDDCRGIWTICFNCPGPLRQQFKLQALKQVYEQCNKTVAISMHTTIDPSDWRERAYNKLMQAIKAVCEEN